MEKMKKASRQQILASSHFDVPGEKDRYQILEIMEKCISPDDTLYFPIGVHCNYLFDFATNSLVYLEDSFTQITGVPKKEVIGHHISKLLDILLEDDQLSAAVKLVKTSFEIMNRVRSTDLTVNLQFNIVPKHKHERRVLFQFKPVAFTSAGLPLIVHGHIVDITHWGLEQPARLSIIHKNELLYHYEEQGSLDPADALPPFNMRELQLLWLKSEGKPTREIAAALQLSETNVYNIVRELKKKTGMPVEKLIELLKTRGLLQPI